MIAENIKIKDISKTLPKITEDTIRKAVDNIIKSGEIDANKPGLDTSSIKGNTSVDELCTTFGISKNDLYKMLEINENDLPLNPKIKDIRELKQKNDPSFEVEMIREVVRKMIE